MQNIALAYSSADCLHGKCVGEERAALAFLS